MSETEHLLESGCKCVLASDIKAALLYIYKVSRIVIQQEELSKKKKQRRAVITS